MNLMTRAWWSKLAFLSTLVVFSGLYVVPSLLSTAGSVGLPSWYPFHQRMNLGLDLQGGLYLVLGVDLQKVYAELLDRQVDSLRDRIDATDSGIKAQLLARPTNAPLSDDPQFQVQFEEAYKEKLRALLKKSFRTLRLVAESSKEITLGLTAETRQDVREKTLNQSIEVIRNRIDEFGVSEPSIASQGSDRVVVELPGIKEVDRAKELIGRTAKLEFKIVDNKSLDHRALLQLVTDTQKKGNLQIREGQKFSDYVRELNQLAQPQLPQGTEIAFGRYQIDQNDSNRVPYLIFSRAEVTGEDLQDASVQFNPENQQPTVSFSLNPRGASLFEKLTGEHIGQPLAIVLDNIVHSAPVIQGKIGGGHGQITLGQGLSDDLMKEAKDLAIVLRAGALPAQLNLLEQRVVGPSLGQDSIRKGAMASLVGSLIVFVFVAIYYRLSGMIAVFSLILNVLFVLAILVALEATLTLPGIAGIALTVGIAVDSNVVIYERIREELRHKRRAAVAVRLGFQKAFKTILDANVTNALAALVLLYYGTGAIKGFAVTLLIGIITTLFTAVFVCELIFELYLSYLEKNRARSLSI